MFHKQIAVTVVNNMPSPSSSSSLAKFLFPPDFSFYELFLVCLYVAHALFSSFHKYRTVLNCLHYAPMDSTGALYLAVHTLFSALFDAAGGLAIPNMATCPDFRRFVQFNVVAMIGTLWFLFCAATLGVGLIHALRGYYSSV